MKSSAVAAKILKATKNEYINSLSHSLYLPLPEMPVNIHFLTNTNRYSIYFTDNLSIIAKYKSSNCVGNLIKAKLTRGREPGVRY